MENLTNFFKQHKKAIIIPLITLVCIIIIALFASVTFSYFTNLNQNDETNLNNSDYMANIAVTSDDVLVVVLANKNEIDHQDPSEEEAKATKEEEEKKKQEEEEEKQKQEEEKKKQEEEKQKQEEKNKDTNTQKTVQSSPSYYIKINRTANTVTIYTKDSSGNYTVPVKSMVCSTGYASPISGVYSTRRLGTWYRLMGGVYGQYCTQITGDILFHSVPYLTRGDNASLEYWAYDKLGTTASAGCVRLTTADAQWIYYNCNNGTQVEFYSSTNPGPLGKPTATKISAESSPYKNWDPTDPNPNNPWKTKPVTTKEENNNQVQNTPANTTSNTSSNVTVTSIENTTGNNQKNTSANTEINTNTNSNNNKNNSDNNSSIINNQTIDNTITNTNNTINNNNISNSNSNNTINNNNVQNANSNNTINNNNIQNANSNNTINNNNNISNSDSNNTTKNTNISNFSNITNQK